MADKPIARLVIDRLDEAPMPLRPFFEERDGKHHMRFEGDVPGWVKSEKLDEFRTNNKVLHARVEELTTQLKAFDGIDPVKAKQAPDPAVVTRLEAERDDALLRAAVLPMFLGQGGLPDTAIGDVITNEAKKTFQVKDGQLNSTQQSTTNPGQPLTLDEWMTAQLTTRAWAFRGSKGGGAANGANHGPHPATTVIDKHDALSFGRNLDAIAAGKARVE